MTLRAPADADQFRVKVGRYGDRWYHDPLPGCDIAPACTDEWPATSIVKNAWPKFLTAWAAGEAAACAVKERHIWEHMAQPAAITYIAKAHDRSRDGAASRGSAVHRIVEAFSVGAEPAQMDVLEAGEWVPACKQLVADLQPEWLLAEAVTINRELGVGGTLDAVIRVDGRNYLVDYKSRGFDKDGKGKHGAYADEGAQLGSYASGYVIVEENGRAVRRALPHLDGGLIITIAPDGYRLHPVNLDVARTLFASLRHFWAAMQVSPIGKPVKLGTSKPSSSAALVAPASAASAPTVDLFAEGSGSTPSVPDPSALRADLEARAKVVMAYPDGVSVLGQAVASRGLTRLSATPDEQLPAWLAAVKDAESDLRVPWPEEPLPTPQAPVTVEPRGVGAPASAPVIGLPASDPAIVAVIERCKALPPDLFAAVEANTVGAGRCPNLISGRATQADLALVDEQVTLAEVEHEGRKAYVASLLQELGDEAVATICAEAAPGRELELLTEADVERVGLLVHAIEQLVVAFAYDDDKPILTTFAGDAEAALVAAHGSKSAALAAAKAAASAHGRISPRSVAAAATDPLIVAAALPLTNQPTQQEKQSA